MKNAEIDLRDMANLGRQCPLLSSVLSEPCVDGGRSANGRALEVTKLFVHIISFM